MKRAYLRWGIGLTLAFEALTILARLLYGKSASEFIEQNDPPFLLQIHHMFWSAPFILVGLLAWQKPAVREPCFSITIGLVLSGLMHHFIVLPIWVGNTGWP